MASSTDTNLDNLVINEVASESVLATMEANNQLEANQIYVTPDAADQNQLNIGLMTWVYDSTNNCLKAVFTPNA